MAVQKVRAGHDHRPRSLNVVMTGTSFEKTNRRDNDQESGNRKTHWQAAPVRGESATMRAKSDDRGERHHGPVHPWGIEPCQPNCGQRCQQQREHGAMHRARERCRHSRSVQHSYGVSSRLFHFVHPSFQKCEHFLRGAVTALVIGAAVEYRQGSCHFRQTRGSRNSCSRH
jgi:hypothetical protein